MSAVSPEREMPLTPAFLIATASAFVGVTEEGGNNRGQMVELFLRLTHIPPGQPWCAAFVAYAGHWSHYDYVRERSIWPLPRTASCWELGEFARREGILARAPLDGDVFLIFDPEKGRFAHTGVIVRVNQEIVRPTGSIWYECVTIEGNTNGPGRRVGDRVARQLRTFYPDAGDRFVRWVALDRREEAGNGKEGNRAA